MESAIPLDAWEILKKRITPERRARMEEVVSKRIKGLRLVLEDLHHPHNISACLRSAEAFGVGEIDILWNKRRFKTTGPSKGVENWLKIRVHENLISCHKSLEGYEIWGAFPFKSKDIVHVVLQDLPKDRPLALVFGNEHDGLSSSWIPHLHGTFTIPTSGFVESLNISVSVGIALSHQTQFYGYLSQEEQLNQLNQWIYLSLKGGSQIYERTLGLDPSLMKM